ncbi:MAG: penicillin-binding protein, partial [Elusimicrobiaceae bacterium]|nr:penicillin-binding protein [Elusimicrobiaceae bacterium]
VGFDDETYSDFKFIGGVHAAPIWTEIMKEFLKNKPVKDFAVPKGISFTFINRDTGKLAMPNEKDKFLEAFKEGTQPTSY